MKGINNKILECDAYETIKISGHQRCVGLKETRRGLYTMIITDNKQLTCKLVWDFDLYKHPVGYSYKLNRPLEMKKHFGLELRMKMMIQKYRRETQFAGMPEKFRKIA